MSITDLQNDLQIKRGLLRTVANNIRWISACVIGECWIGLRKSAQWNAMPNSELMTEAEIHDFGVEAVVGFLQKEGYAIEGINPKIGYNPQIMARKGDLYKFIAVRTACYPNKGKIATPEEFITLIKHAENHGALPYFAAVGIANADSKNAEECGTPVRGAPYHILFDGLLIMTTNDKIKILGENSRPLLRSAKPFGFLNKIANPKLVILIAIITLALLLDAISMAWGEIRFVAGFAESFVAIVLHWSILFGGVAGGVYAGYKVVIYTSKNWLGWIAGIVACAAIWGLGTFANEIPGVGWRMKRMLETSSDYEY